MLKNMNGPTIKKGTGMRTAKLTATSFIAIFGTKTQVWSSCSDMKHSDVQKVVKYSIATTVIYTLKRTAPENVKEAIGDEFQVGFVDQNQK